MLALTVELLESDEEARHLVQAQKTWISVDEYQDTNPLQERLLELWLGDSRRPRGRGRSQTRRSTPSPAPRPITCSALPRQAPGRQDDRSDPELQVNPAGPRAGQPAHRGWTTRRADYRPTTRPRAHDRALRRTRGRAGRPRRRHPAADRCRHRGVGDRCPRPHQRAAAADRGRADPGGHPLQRPWPALLPAQRGPRGSPAPAPHRDCRDRRRARGRSQGRVRQAAGLRAGRRDGRGGGSRTRRVARPAADHRGGPGRAERRRRRGGPDGRAGSPGRS